MKTVFSSIQYIVIPLLSPQDCKEPLCVKNPPPPPSQKSQTKQNKVSALVAVFALGSHWLQWDL